ncbi:MAG: hypothetical protein AAFY65_02675 [Pseudomonadota bacterium]
MIILSLISDIFLVAATLGLAGYCMVLSRKLKAFNDVDTGVGGAIATLSMQVDRLEQSLKEAEADAEDRQGKLTQALAAADDRIGKLDVLLASLDDVETDYDDVDPPEPAQTSAALPSFRATRAPNIDWPAE